jgi:hypothetical protein
MRCRHCEERSDEAIHVAAQRKNGLLRFARNDGEGLGLLRRAGLRLQIGALVDPRDARQQVIDLGLRGGGDGGAGFALCR